MSKSTSAASVPKRSRKKIIELSTNMSVIEEIVAAAAHNDTSKLNSESCTDASKKSRGRKTKVVPISQKTEGLATATNTSVTANIILQLKCCLKDLREYNSLYNSSMTNPTEYNPAVPPAIMTYNEDTHSNYYPYDKSSLGENTDAEIAPVEPTKDQITVDDTILTETVCPRCNCDANAANSGGATVGKSSLLHQKVKKLKIQLYKSVNEGPGKQAACFWCTYDFDTPACYIPKYETEDAMHAYGSFCSPNCAAAYLLNENINDSIRFERYSLLNWVYSSMENGTAVNIHPAPNPYYTLQKFYGNLSIQEYRKLTQSENHRLIVLERPLTRILPELHEENNATRQQPIASEENKMNMGMGGFRVRKESEKAMRASKADIVRDRFGITGK